MDSVVALLSVEASRFGAGALASQAGDGLAFGRIDEVALGIGGSLGGFGDVTELRLGHSPSRQRLGRHGQIAKLASGIELCAGFAQGHARGASQIVGG